ncbi:hypothetical protein FACS189490_05100 [Clostridia bacterium]|nr:hypothetical protein FACS189490_05100 [Clostridia bacterium]
MSHDARFATKAEFVGSERNNKYELLNKICLENITAEGGGGVPLLFEHAKEADDIKAYTYVDGSDAHSLVLGVTGSKKIA